MSTEKIPESNFADRIRSLRGDRTKADFARFLGIPPPVYQRYEEGRIPSADNLMVISSRCGVSVDWLLGQSESHQPPLPRMSEAEKSCVPQCDADSPMRRLMEIEKEQQQISRQLAGMDNLRRRYAQLMEEQLDILSQLGTSRSYTDEQIAAIRSRHKTKAQLINSAVKKRDT